MEALHAHRPQLFFATFGYLVLPGVLADAIRWVSEEFEAVWRDRGVVHDGTKRSCIVPFIDQRERLCTLLDHPGIGPRRRACWARKPTTSAATATTTPATRGWHSDGFHHVGRYLKVALYLDPVTRDTGCLRVIPGTHRLEAEQGWAARQARPVARAVGHRAARRAVRGAGDAPGDVVAFNHNLMHASFGGSTRRRMFTLNFCSHCETPAEIEDLERFINAQARFWIDHLHSDVMRGPPPQAHAPPAPGDGARGRPRGAGRQGAGGDGRALARLIGRGGPYCS